jgi:hypothetical protein
MYAYKAYARQLGAFLQCPCASAALLRGGILRKLRKAFFEDHLELFLGSTGRVKKFRQATGFSPGTWGWDDTIAKEVDPIAGTHHTCIGKCNNPGNETRPFPTNSGPQPRRASMENYFLVAASFDNEGCELVIGPHLAKVGSRGDSI